MNRKRDRALSGVMAPRVLLAALTLLLSWQSRPGDDQVAASLRWLTAHQEADGRWPTGRFVRGEPAAACTEPGQPGHETLATGLAALAFLEAGSTRDAGPHQLVIRRAVAWLVAQQNRKDGFIGLRQSGTALQGHAVATLLLV